jgi:hypothetical protein
MNKCNIAFHNPYYWGCFNLTTDQQDEEFIFEMDFAIMEDALITVNVEGSDNIVKRYTNGNGFVLSNDNKTLVLTVQGEDFIKQVDRKLNFNLSFYGTGDVEGVFDLKIIKGLIQ